METAIQVSCFTATAKPKVMRLAGISFTSEHEMPIFYREEQIGTRRVDFLIEGLISVELKAIT